MARKPTEPVATAAELVTARQLWPIQEAAWQLGMHRNSVYRLAKAGELRLTKIGSRTYVTDRELNRYIAHAEAQSA
jgi:excisionase family DNA binding protein